MTDSGEHTVLAGTSDALYAVPVDDLGNARPPFKVLENEWVTSIKADDPLGVLLTTRSGRLLRLSGRTAGPEELARVPFRLWFASRLVSGDIVLGGTADHLVRLGNSGREPGRFEKLEYGSAMGWTSHSGGQAHVHSLTVGRDGSEYIAVEVGGVFRRDGPTCQPVGDGLDPDVHAISVGAGPSDILAGTGTGVFRLHSDGKWRPLPQLPLPYVQGLVITLFDDVIVTASRTPFGRRPSGPYKGTSTANEFGVFKLCSETRSWVLMDPDGRWNAGVLSKAIVAPAALRGDVVVGDLGGRLLMSSGDKFSVVSTDLGAIECVAFVPHRLTYV